MPPNEPNGVQLVDRLAYRIIDSLHKLFGFQYARNEEFYIYRFLGTLDASGNLSPGGSVTGTVRITQEADFICTKIVGSTRWTGASASGTQGHAAGLPRVGDLFTVNGQAQLPDNPWTVKLVDGSTDRQLMNDPIDAACMVGDARLPFILPKPRLFARNANLSIEITALYDANVAEQNYRVELDFVGWKVFDVQALDLTTRR